MTLYEFVKENVTVLEAALLYGIELDRYGKALCPFHQSRHSTLIVRDRQYHCVSCGADGDVIDFTANLFGLDLFAAAVKLAADFCLFPEPPVAGAIHMDSWGVPMTELRKEEFHDEYRSNLAA